MDTTHNYPHAVLAALDARPEGIALQSGTAQITNAQMANRLRVFARHLQARGVRPGSLVVIALKNDATASFLGLAANLVGAGWARFHPKMPFAQLSNAFLLHDPDWPAKLRFPGMFVVDDSWAVPPRAAEIDLPGLTAPEDISYLTSTSGTTGVPKFVRHRAMYMRDRTGIFDMGPHRCCAILFPLSTSRGFRVLVNALIAGTRIVKPTVTAGAVTDLRDAGVDLVFASPAQLDALCKDQPPMAPRIPMARAGGALMTPAALRHWRNYFEDLLLGYGSTEAGVVGLAHITRDSDLNQIAYDLLPGTQVEILDDAGAPCPAGVAGAVRLRGHRSDTVTDYLGAPDASAEVFRDRWFHPGDIGMLTPEGKLCLMGRSKDQFNLGGVKFNAADVDAAAAEVDGVHAAMCGTILSDTGIAELFLCATKSADAPEDSTAAAIRAACRTRVGPSVQLKGIAFVDQLPMTDTGKPLRREIATLTAGRALL